MLQLPPPPPGVDLTQDRRPSIIATSIVTWALAVACVVLRILARRMKGVDLWLDDWLMIASLLPQGAHVFGISVYSVSRGVGRHVWVNPPDSLYAWAIGLFIAEIGYFVTLMLVKWSILAFYWRSFNVRRSIKIPIISLAVIVLCWGLAVTFATIFQCKPTNAWWDRFHPTHPLDDSQYTCPIASTKFFYSNAIPTIITDIAMMILPIPSIMKLQLPKGQKFALVCIFCVGLFVTIVSIVRLHYLIISDLSFPDVTWNFVDICLWSVIECNTAIICACLPFLRPILSKISFGRFNLSSVQSSKRQGQSTTHNKMSVQGAEPLRPWEQDDRFGTTTSHARAFSTTKSDEHPFAQLTDNGSDRSLSTKPEEGWYELKGVQAKRSSIRLDGIVITKEVHMQHQNA